MGSTRIHPELRRVAAVLPRHLVGPRSLRLIRVAQSLADRRPLPERVTVERWEGVEVRVHRPTRPIGAAAPGVVWIHGGGHVIGSPAQDDRWCAEMSDRLGAVVAAVRYRRSPEHPHPAALDDCATALRALAALPEVDPTRIAIAGASAGGGLAAALAIVAAARCGITPVLQLLVYPMLDDRTVGRPERTPRDLRLWDRRSNEFGWRCYLGRTPGGSGIDATAAPARQVDMSALPAAWIGVGTVDLFYDEDIAYAERLRAAGVACDLVEVPGAFHGFDSVAPATTVARRFSDDQIDALARAFALDEPR